jgi:magnesium chelatase subunit I
VAGFPFSAIVGQDEMKRALLIAAVEPRIGGVMVFGDRGNGKSTAARALAALLPPMRIVAGCAYNCAPDPAVPCTHGGNGKIDTVAVPFVDLPLGATEDRITGALDIERALVAGVKAFEPGLLARAHRGFLYIDEINLLEDHLVDLLLDVSASGENVVEREGLSVRHAARFVLIGSGNPEEGELRPQLLDRFGLSVEVRSPGDVDTRIEIMRRCDDFERGAAGFVDKWRRADRSALLRIAKARKALPQIDVPDEAMRDAAELCVAVGADGLRGELTLMRAARAEAALAGHDRVTREDVRRMAPMALRHRLRRDVLDETGSTARIDRAAAELWG